MYELYHLLVEISLKTKMDLRLEIFPEGSGQLVDLGWDDSRYTIREWESFAEGIEELKKELAKYE